ncbi:hypothetical protein [Mesorhizobium sp. ES1-3]|uniref:hypothetical protein n=1 Tax=Mesorhizobium sp. ES1-3 TaxID=2876628 RepID=UPI001CCC5394|nr:hypothetical protein [Mesorhizobium sp. ES1-3]MBZ9672568.1 hypothetical protein [Mesorhizobium sp. ES1-3]
MISIHRAANLPECSDQLTLIVIGCGRGGTSLVAGAASILGVDMGSPHDSINHEDMEIVFAAQNRNSDGILIDETVEVNIERVVNIIRKRNIEKTIWGWKDPSADMYLAEVANELRNPFVLFVNRDMAAIAQSEVKQMQCSIEQAYEMALLRFGRYWELLQKLRWPTLFVSYERAALDPESLLSGIADFVGLDQPSGCQLDLVRRFASGRAYRALA